MTLPERWRRLRSLAHLLARAPRRERPILLRAVWGLGVSWLRLRFPRSLRGYALAAREWASRPGPNDRAGDPARLAEAIGCFESVQAALPMSVPCLPRSLALGRLLRGQGFAPELRMGMANEAGELRGHAWIDVGGTASAESRHPAQGFRLLQKATYNEPAEGGTHG